MGFEPTITSFTVKGLKPLVNSRHWWTISFARNVKFYDGFHRNITILLAVSFNSEACYILECP